MIQTHAKCAARAHRLVAVALLAFAGSACSNAAEPSANASAATPSGALHAERGWIRATPPNAPVAGGYMTLRNTGTTEDRLVSVSSPDAQRVEMHEMRMDGGAMQMRALPDGVAVKPGATMAFAPGGSHLMFIGPTRAFRAGEQVQVTLTYAKAPKQTLSFAVQPLGSTVAPASRMVMPEDEGGHSHH